MTDLPQMTHLEVLKVRLQALRLVHRELDLSIRQEVESHGADTLALSRMKRRKLGLKDQIARVVDEINPDIIA